MDYRPARRPAPSKRSLPLVKLAGLLSALLLLAACGGGGGSIAPSSPPALPPPSISSVTVSPSTATVTTGATQQFTAAVQGTGNFNAAVNWLVNDVAGGNATVGTITTAGLYTAPASVPNPATVTVKAVSVADASRSGTAAATVEPPPPLPNITWSPSSVETILSPGESGAENVTFRSDQSFQNAVIEATGDIAQFVTITPSSLANVPAGQDQAVTVTFSIPAGAALGTTTGIVKVRSGEQGLPNSMTAVANIWETQDSDGVSFKSPPEWAARIIPKSGDAVPVMAIRSPSGSILVVLKEGGSDHDFNPELPLVDAPISIDGHPAIRTEQMRPDGSVSLVRVVFSPARSEAPKFELEFIPGAEASDTEVVLEGVLQTLRVR